jgi:pimeloyl-ACP methyl ester carboxylesterase
MCSCEYTGGALQAESRYVRANGINHHYLTWGDPDKPPLVMAHGIGLCAQVWNWSARDLAHDYYVMSFDLRGHGDTDKPGIGYTFEQLGADMAAIIQTRGLERPFGVGHSAGGMSLIIADSLVPGTVGKVVLADTRVGASPMMMLSPSERQERMARTSQKRLIWESREAMYAAYRERRVFKTWTDEVFRDYIGGGTTLREDGRAELKCPTEVEATFYQSRVALDTSRFLKGLEGQYLLLVGNYPGAQTEQDQAVQQLLQESKDSRFKALQRGSHFAPMEYPDLVQSEIRQFLDEGQPAHD